MNERLLVFSIFKGTRVMIMLTRREFFQFYTPKQRSHKPLLIAIYQGMHLVIAQVTLPVSSIKESVVVAPY